jgi:WD40 repeat protein
MTPDARRALVLADSDSALVWNLQSGAGLQRFDSAPPSRKELRMLANSALSADGKRVLINSGNPPAPTVWDADTGTKIARFQPELDGVPSLALSGDGKHALIHEMGQNRTYEWDLDSDSHKQHTHKEVKGIEFDARPTVALTNDGRRALVAGEDSAVICVLRSEEPLQMLKAEGMRISAMALAPSGDRAVTAFWSRREKRAILWDAQTGKALCTFKGHDAAISCAGLTPDGKLVVTGAYDGVLIAWDGESGKRLQTMKGHTGQINSVAISADGKFALTGSSDSTARLWDAVGGKELCRLISLNGGKEWLVFTPDGLFDGSKEAGKYLKYRNTETGEVVPLESCRKRFHMPGLLAKLMKGERPVPKGSGSE